MEKRAPMSQSQEVREMFHTRFDGCLVELRHNRTVNRRTDRRTNRQTNGKTGTYVTKSGGQGDVSCKV